MSELPTGTVTFLFTDIEGSTPLWERDPKAMKESLAQHHAILHKAIQEHDGRVFQIVGDAFCAAFAFPSQAIEAAVAAQRELAEAEWGETGPLRVRMGIHTGPVDLVDGEYRSNHTFNRVARIMSCAYGEQVVVSLEAKELARRQMPGKIGFMDLGEHSVKGMTQVEHLFQVVAPGLRAEFPPLTSKSAVRHNLPTTLAPFIGREREIAGIVSLLDDPAVRLVTLTGPGGTGKTRLGLQVANTCLEHFKDGVFFVDLIMIVEPDLLAATIAKAIGIQETPGQPVMDTLKGYLHDRQLLLVMDNFEQVISAAPMVADLLFATTALKILITSREILRVSGEQVYPVPPMRLPILEKNEPVSTMKEYESIQLFLQRAKAVQPGFNLTHVNAKTVARICVRLDGLPLAIELAASRLRILTPTVLLEQLSDQLRVLSSGPRDVHFRQRTLRATLDWSYGLLGEEEKRLFARLAVFQGGCVLDAVEQVCGMGLGLEILEGLESLVDKSLLRQVSGPDGNPRFVFLETIHGYASEKLEGYGENSLLQKRHAEYLLALLEQVEPHLYGGPQWAHWTLRLSAEVDNLRAAIVWGMGGADVELGLRLAGAFHWIWYQYGYSAEWQRLIERAIVISADVSPDIRAKLLLASGASAYADLNFERGRAHLREAVNLFRKQVDPHNTAFALIWLGLLLSGQPDEYEEAVSFFEEGLTLFREVGDQAAIAMALNVYGEFLRSCGNYQRAKTTYEECLVLARKLGDQLREQLMYVCLGYVAVYEGYYEQGEEVLKAGLALALEIDVQFIIPVNLAALAGAVAGKGQPERAARLLGAAQALMETIGVPLEPADRLEIERYEAATRAQLDESSFAAAWAEGRTMSLEKAVEYALGPNPAQL